jgi:hypothetical protein
MSGIPGNDHRAGLRSLVEAAIPVGLHRLPEGHRQVGSARMWRDIGHGDCAFSRLAYVGPAMGQWSLLVSTLLRGIYPLGKLN